MTRWVERLAADKNDVRLRSSIVAAEDPAVPVTAEDRGSPDDRLEAALSELRQTVAAELLEMLGQVSPTYFETIVLDLLHRMGYGTSREDLQRLGRVNDGGIDGVISLDRLGLEKVYVQAKRWQGSVGRPEVQAFYGALAGQRANKGVFLTTATFTSQAVEFHFADWLRYSGSDVATRVMESSVVSARGAILGRTRLRQLFGIRVAQKRSRAIMF